MFQVLVKIWYIVSKIVLLHFSQHINLRVDNCLVSNANDNFVGVSHYQ